MSAASARMDAVGLVTRWIGQLCSPLRLLSVVLKKSWLRAYSCVCEERCQRRRPARLKSSRVTDCCVRLCVISVLLLRLG